MVLSLVPRRGGSQRLVVALVLGAIVARPLPARAFSTRVHIALANQVHDALRASGDGTIQLRLSGATVILPSADAAAILAHPEAFRAGAIGPDNTVFPGLTDPSHGVAQDPFGQCQLVYEAAVTSEERAYALGCFLHGASDAVAHHYVNYFAGETFTLAPLEDGRMFGYGNMVRHIATEAMIQDALYRHAPAAFDAAALTHTIPRDFVMRTYFDLDSPAWMRASEHARGKLDDARSLAGPDATLLEVIDDAGLAPADHLVLLPVYLDELRGLRAIVRADLERRIAALQADGELRVMAGPDGTRGTPDDTTACTATCLTKWATYTSLVGILAPRRDATGHVLPSAFTAIMDKLDDDLALTPPALVDSIAEVSDLLNRPLTAAGSSLDLTPAVVETAFVPLTDQLDRTTTIDYQGIKVAILPTALLNLDGTGIDLTALIRGFFQPYVDEIKAVIRDRVLGEARAFLEGFIVEYQATSAAYVTATEARIDELTDPALGGGWFDEIDGTGLWGYAFNLVAATLAEHDVMLSAGDEVADAPASFDASHTLAWTQAALCENLRPAVFPFGVDTTALLTVRTDRDYPAIPGTDSPIECHDGALTSFGTPSVAACELIGLDALIAAPAHRGSLTRAYPPTFAAAPPGCRGVVVPGLPLPPDAPGGDEAGGCCQTSDGGGAGSLLLALGVLVGLGSRRRVRRRRLPLSSAVAALLVVGCGGDPGGMGGDPDARAADTGVDAEDHSGALVAALGDSVWRGSQTRLERHGPVTRAYELHFRASTREWVEIRNPFGPARQRTLRSFVVEPDGVTVRSVVRSPLGWPHNPDNGREDVFRVEVVDGGPRVLRLTDQVGNVEQFTEGAIAPPVSGLTAEVRAFATGDGSPHDRFCDNAGFGVGSDGDRQAIWDFARGVTTDELLAADHVAATRVGTWAGHPWAMTDLLGFRPEDPGGGTPWSYTQNFTVRYTGRLAHPGGDLGFQERNDHLEDVFWIWTGADVGSRDPARLFMEVHNYPTPNRTACNGTWNPIHDQCFGVFPAGALPIEIIVVRCTEPLEDPMQLEITFDPPETLTTEPVFGDLDAATFTPSLTPALFPGPFAP